MTILKARVLIKAVNHKNPSAKPVKMHSFGMPFIHWCMVGDRLTYGNQIEWNQILAYVKNLPDGIDSVLMWIEAGPHSTESESVRGKQYIF